MSAASKDAHAKLLTCDGEDSFRSNKCIRSSIDAAVLTVVALLLSVQIEAATAGSIKITAHGMIQLKAFGETVLFREADAGNISFSSLLIEPCHAPRYDDIATLSVILSNTEFRECIERMTPNHTGLYVGIIGVTPQQEGEYLYPGPVRSSAFPSFSLNSTNNTNPYAVIFNRIRIELGGNGGNFACYHHIVQGTPDPLGFVNQSFHPSEGTQYELPAHLRKGGASRSLCMRCAPILSDQKNQTCGIRLETPDKLTSMVLSWNTFGFHGSNPSWLTYDETARTIANSIFVGRPKGDLQ